MDTNKRMMLLSLLLAAFPLPTSAGEWKARVAKDLDAVVDTCVVIPCSFTHPHGNLPTSRLRGIWYLEKNPDKRIYDEDKDEVMEKFRDRTKLLGQLGQNNCTLQIIDIKDHDNGPFCLQIRILQEEAQTTPTEAHSFLNDCVQFNILPDPPTPTVTHPKVAYEDQPYTLTCSVRHTCPSPSHRPNITWSRGEKGEISEVHKELHLGTWEVLSILTFIPQHKDDHSEVTCTAWFGGGKTASTTTAVYIKRKDNFSYIIIPAVVGIGTAAFFGAACFIILKKYRRRISELQNQDGSMWNRLSRVSRRIRSVSPGPSCSDQSTTQKRSNNCKIQKASKPRFPSPERLRSQQRSFSYKQDPEDNDYINTADLQIYGNL